MYLFVINYLYQYQHGRVNKCKANRKNSACDKTTFIEINYLPEFSFDEVLEKVMRVVAFCPF